MTGEQLREKLINLDSSLAKIARKVGMTPQNLNVMLKTKDIKTGFIEKLAKIYHKDVLYFYDGKGGPASDHDQKSAFGSHINPGMAAADDSYLLALLEEKDKRIQLLEEIIKKNNIL